MQCCARNPRGVWITGSFRKVAHACSNCLACAARVELWHTLEITSLELRAASAPQEFSAHSPGVSDKEMTGEKKKICFFLVKLECMNMENTPGDLKVTSPWLWSNYQRHFPRIWERLKKQCLWKTETFSFRLGNMHSDSPKGSARGLHSVIRAIQVSQTQHCS